MDNKYQKYFTNFDIAPGDIRAVLKALKNKDISWSDRSTKDFENQIAKFFGVKYALANCNGTTAMLAAMYGAGVKSGDEVICPSYTWWSSISPALFLGAIPVFCEIKSDNLTIDPVDVEKKISRRTKAIVVPHLWGNYGDVLKIKEIIKMHAGKIHIIEDVSHAIGAKLGGRLLGNLGDAGIFSLQASKVLTAGEGGVLITNNKFIYERAVYLGHYERIKDLKNSELLKYKKTGGGLKFRIHPLGCALALSQLVTLKDRLARQNHLTSYFEKKLAEIRQMELAHANPPDFRRGGILNIKAKIKSKIIKNNMKLNILSNNFIYKERLPLLHLEPLFKKNKGKYVGKKALPNSEKLYNTLYSFPVFYRGNKKIINKYVSVVKRVINFDCAYEKYK